MSREHFDKLSLEIQIELQTKQIWTGNIDGDDIKIIDRVDEWKDDPFASCEIELYINGNKIYADPDYLDLFYIVPDIIDYLELKYVEWFQRYLIT